MSQLIIPNHINHDVVVFRGHTRKEMMALGLMSLALTAFTLSVVSLLLFSSMIYGFAMSFPLSILVGWSLATLLQGFKRDKPKGYLSLKWRLWCDVNGVMKTTLVYQSAVWRVKREVLP